MGFFLTCHACFPPGGTDLPWLSLAVWHAGAFGEAFSPQQNSSLMFPCTTTFLSPKCFASHFLDLAKCSHAENPTLPPAVLLAGKRQQLLSGDYSHRSFGYLIREGKTHPGPCKMQTLHLRFRARGREQPPLLQQMLPAIFPASCPKEKT